MVGYLGAKKKEAWLVKLCQEPKIMMESSVGITVTVLLYLLLLSPKIK